MIDVSTLNKAPDHKYKQTHTHNRLTKNTTWLH